MTLTDTDLSVAVETSFTSATIRLGRVVADGVGMALSATRRTSVDCRQHHQQQLKALKPLPRQATYIAVQ